MGFIAIDFTAWTTYLQAGLAAVVAWMIKTLIAQGKDLVEIQTTMKYYIERQTADALERLDKGNPAPPEIVELARRRIHGQSLTDLETRELTNWLRWTGTGQNPTADSAERSAALQLLTGFKTRTLLEKPKRRWWQLL